MDSILFVAPLLGLAALVFAFVLAQRITKADPGNERMKELGKAIHDGAMAFLNREHKIPDYLCHRVVATDCCH